MKLLIAAVLCYFAVSAQAVSRIVGGSEVPDGKYPFVVSVKLNNNHKCTGSLLNERTVLTAAHCVKPEYLNSYTVKVGTNEQANPDTGVTYEVERFTVHEQYDGYDYDLALLHISEDIEFNDKVRPINLVKDDSFEAGYQVTAMGWGETYFGSGAPNELQEVDVNIVEQNQCTDNHNVLSHSFICTLKQEGQGVCRGDSGGPLVADGVQIGIASKAVLCALGYPDVFIRVYHYLDWIMLHL